MDTLKLLVSGPASLLPVFAAAILLGRAYYLGGDHSRKRGMTQAQRLRRLRFCRSMVPVLPLLGIMGTVVGLVRTLSYMGSMVLGASGAMTGVIHRFAPALASTFWGVVGAISCIVLIESTIHAAEDDPDE